MVQRFFLFLLFSSSLLGAGSFSLDQISSSFPSKGFEDEVEFWKEIFTEYGDREVLIHDQNDVRLIYEVVRFAKGVRDDDVEYKRQHKELEKREKQWQQLFEEIRRYGSDSEKLTGKHKKIIRLLESHGYSPSSQLLRELGRNIRAQRGIKEKFREGLIRSGQYLSKIETIFQAYGLPTELALLPHVESSFDYGAYSKRGAAGIWQFIRGTGRRYMKINRSVDERLDPLKSSEAAARLFRENYDTLESWPLAVTAFNHGTNGMARAKKRFGADMGKIIQEYQSRSFGFASKNFYVEVLAAVSVARNYSDYFGPLEFASPRLYDTLSLKRSHRLSHFTQIQGLTEDILRDYNPHIMADVWQRSKILPAGLEIHLPHGQGETIAAVLETVPAASAPILVADNGAMGYRVQDGDTLLVIANRVGSSVSTLQLANNLSNPDRIYPGQFLLVSEASERPTQYRVRPGDTLIEIAMKFGTSLRQLQSMNLIDDPHLIFLGQVLLIP